MINRLFSPPEYSKPDEKSRTALLLHQLAMFSWSLPILAVLVSIINPPTIRFVLPAGLILAFILAVIMVLNHNGRTASAAYLFAGAVFTLLTYLNYVGAGETRPLILLSVITIMVSGLLFSSRGAILATLLLSIQNIIIVSLRLNGLIIVQNQPPTIIQGIIVTTVSYLLIGFMFQLAIARTQLVINQIRESENKLQSSNLELQNLSASLEQRVIQRTMELQEQQKISLRRSRQFEGIARVSKAISATKNLQEALPQIAQVISQQFGFYHVGIFLSDSAGQFAVLSASNSEGGRRMLARGHQLKIGEQGIVGNVAQTGKARLAKDVGTDVIYFTNADLPLTQSELALPLKIEDRVIGALDIQSTDINAFFEEDIEALGTLADQVSLAIQNARLFDQTQKTILEAEAIQRQYLRETWSRLPKEENLSGYRYSVSGIVPLGDGEVNNFDDMKGKNEILVPIILRGETIGTLAVQTPKNEHISADQIDLIKAVAERVALSAENARLFEETTRRAERERIISDIATKIGTSVRTESILRTTASELSQLLDGADVFIKLGTDNEAG